MHSMTLMLYLLALINATSQRPETTGIKQNTAGIADREAQSSASNEFYSVESSTVNQEKKESIDVLQDKLKKCESLVKEIKSHGDEIGSLVDENTLASRFAFSFAILLSIGCTFSFFISRWIYIGKND